MKWLTRLLKKIFPNKFVAVLTQKQPSCSDHKARISFPT